MRPTRFVPFTIFLLAAAPATARAQVLFFDDFESGLRQWPIRGSAVTSSAEAFAGASSLTFTTVTGGGDAFTGLLPVVPGRRYYLHTAYMTLGGGGYIGIDQHDAAGKFLSERWLIGDGECCTLTSWDYTVARPNPDLLGEWKVYTRSYIPPSGVQYVRIKAEDYDGGLPNDPRGAGVWFDNVEWSQDPVPNYAPSLYAAGACPGPVALVGGGLAPGGTVALLSASGPGAFAVPVGPCGGTMLGLDRSSVVFHGTFSADATGTLRLAPHLPGQACGRIVQLLDLWTCRPSTTDAL